MVERLRPSWRLPPRSVAARSAVAAALVAAVLFTGGAMWLRHVVYTERMAATEQKVRAEILRHGNAVPPLEGGPPAIGQDFTYEVVHSDGRVLFASPDLRPFDALGPVMPVPTPPGHGFVVDHAEEYTVRLGAPVADAGAVTEAAARRDLSGRTLRALATDTVRLRQLSDGLTVGVEEVVRLYVFITPFEAEAAVAAVDRVLWPVVPVAVLLVAAVAWAATNRALRPVEQIRAQAAEISDRALHRRVPVPPSRDAIARLATTLNHTLDRLEDAADRQRRFIADAAHELRSPIASLRTVLEVALEHADRADWPRVAHDAVADAERLHSLADDLLLLARFDADQPAPTSQLDLAELAREDVERRTTRLQITCRTAGPAPLLGNPDHLRRMLRNLLDNAERHARCEVTVTVHTEADSRQVVLEVCDDGPGIPPADRERVFQRFTRLDEARTRDHGGAGLGLAIARDIAVRHGGRLVVADTDTGARLVASFPVA